jgi:hypothetical protein
MPQLREGSNGLSSFDRLQTLTSQRKVGQRWSPTKRRIPGLAAPQPHAASVAKAAVAFPGPRADPSPGYTGPQYRRVRVRRSREQRRVKTGAELARQEISAVNAALTDWSHGGEVSMTRSSNAVFRRPHSVSSSSPTPGETSGSAAPRMLPGMGVPALQLKDQLVQLVDYDMIAAELNMPTSLVAATAASLESRAPYENYESDERAVFGAVLDSRNRLVDDLYALPADSRQTSLDGPAKWHTMSQPGARHGSMSPAALEAQLTNQRRMQADASRQQGMPPADLWETELARRHEQRAVDEAAADERWQAAAGPGSMHRAEVDAFRKSKLGLSGKLHGWQEQFKQEAQWLATRQVLDASAAEDPETRWARIEQETAPRLPGWYYSEEQRSVRESQQMQLEDAQAAADQARSEAEAAAADRRARIADRHHHHQQQQQQQPPSTGGDGGENDQSVVRAPLPPGLFPAMAKVVARMAAFAKNAKANASTVEVGGDEDGSESDPAAAGGGGGALPSPDIVIAQKTRVMNELSPQQEDILLPEDANPLAKEMGVEGVAGAVNIHGAELPTFAGHHHPVVAPKPAPQKPTPVTIDSPNDEASSVPATVTATADGTEVSPWLKEAQLMESAIAEAKLTKDAEDQAAKAAAAAAAESGSGGGGDGEGPKVIKKPPRKKKLGLQQIQADEDIAVAAATASAQPEPAPAPTTISEPKPAEQQQEDEKDEATIEAEAAAATAATTAAKSLAASYTQQLIAKGVELALASWPEEFNASTHPEQWSVFSSMDADGNGSLDTDELFFALVSSSILFYVTAPN